MAHYNKRGHYVAWFWGATLGPKGAEVKKFLAFALTVALHRSRLSLLKQDSIVSISVAQEARSL